MDERFAAAVAALDAANGADPFRLRFQGVEHPKELLHAELLTAWIRRLVPDPGAELLLAARAHHLRRWERPRADYPAGRHGYLRWRRDAHGWHAEIAEPILRVAGYDEETVKRTANLIAKRVQGDDPEGQTMEDGLCLVFLETQLDELAGKLDREKMIDILRKSWAKMSAVARELALGLAFSPSEFDLVREALGQE